MGLNPKIRNVTIITKFELFTYGKRYEGFPTDVIVNISETTFVI